MYTTNVVIDARASLGAVFGCERITVEIFPLSARDMLAGEFRARVTAPSETAFNEWSASMESDTNETIDALDRYANDDQRACTTFIQRIAQP